MLAKETVEQAPESLAAIKQKNNVREDLEIPYTMRLSEKMKPKSSRRHGLLLILQEARDVEELLGGIFVDQLSSIIHQTYQDLPGVTVWCNGYGLV